MNREDGAEYQHSSRMTLSEHAKTLPAYQRNRLIETVAQIENAGEEIEYWLNVGPHLYLHTDVGVYCLELWGY